MTGCGCMSGGKRRRTRRTRRRSRRTKRKMSKHHRRRSSRHRRSRRSRRTRRRRGGRYLTAAAYQLSSQGARNPTYLLTGGANLLSAPSNYKVVGGYKKQKRGGTGKKSLLRDSATGLH